MREGVFRIAGVAPTPSWRLPLAGAAVVKIVGGVVLGVGELDRPADAALVQLQLA